MNPIIEIEESNHNRHEIVCDNEDEMKTMIALVMCAEAEKSRNFRLRRTLLHRYLYVTLGKLENEDLKQYVREMLEMLRLYFETDDSGILLGLLDDHIKLLVQNEEFRNIMHYIDVNGKVILGDGLYVLKSCVLIIDEVMY